MPNWNPLERVAFRFVFVYFTMFFVGSLLDTGPMPRKVLALLADTPVRWFAQGVLHLPDSSIGGPRWALAQQVFAFAIAGFIAIVWSFASRRSEYDRLRGWFWIGLRYYVAIAMLVYGAFKVIQSQFPPLSFAQLSQPLGALAPMGLLWAFMGYSTLYATFAGVGEFVGAFLLFFRKTTTLGSLILIAVLSNVALLNYTFDVPVKQLSTNLLFASVVLASPDTTRLADVLLFNRPSVPADRSFDFRRRWVYSVRRVLKPLIVVLAPVATLTASAFFHRNLENQPVLFGVYDVEAFTPSAGEADGARWRRVMFDLGGTVTIRHASDSTSSFRSTTDTNKHTIVLRRRGAADSVVYSYATPSPDVLRLTGDGASATLHRIDEQKAFPLLRRR